MKLYDKLRYLLARITRPDEPQSNHRLWTPGIQAGMRVNHDTAMTYSAVYRAISYISSQLAMLPWRVMVEQGNRREINATHPVDKLLHRKPNPEMSAFTFRELMVSHALSWGNGYAEIEIDAANRPIALWPISPDRVEVKRIEGQVVYEISNSRDGKSYLAPAQVFHLHGPGFDGLCGYSVINLASRAIGLGMGAEQYGAAFFQNGTSMSGVLEHPGNLSEAAIENLRNSWNAQYQGPGKAHKPVILEEGMSWKPISIPPNDAQFLETRQFQVDDIARWYGLPPHKLQSMEKATFSNIEHQSIEVVGDALQPWATRLEQEANRKLFPDRAAFYTKLNMNALLRGDVESRAKFYREMWNLGVLSPNEIRELEDMNPIPNGDKRFVQLNMTTLEKAGEEPQPAPQVETEPEEEPDDSVQQAANKIVRREMFRLHDAATRYASDRDGFIGWMIKFFNQQESYATKEFLKLNIDMADVVKSRTANARLKMLEYFDEGVAYPVDALERELIDMVRRQAA